jgi:hypothetical protein
MYKIKVSKRKVLYFADWESACAFCLAAGISLKQVRAA